MSVVALDTETYWNRKLKYTVRTQIVDQYAASPLFECFLVSACDGVTSWAGEPSAFNWESLNGQTLVSHNARFDKAIIAEMIKRGQIPKFTPAAWLCSADMTSYLCNRRSLDAAVEHLLGQKVDKTVRADSHAKHWPADFSADEQTAMLKYAREDALWTWRLFDKFGHLWPANERRLSNLMSDQGKRGIAIDAALLDQYILQSHEIKTNTEKLLPWLSDSDEAEDWDDFETKPTSLKCISEQCRRSGIPSPPVKCREGEEAFEEWELKYGARHPWISALSSWRSCNKLYKTFCILKERLREDNVLPFGQRYFGTHTGRVAGESQINLFNQRKQAVLANENGIMETETLRIDAAHKERKKTGAWPTWVRYGIDFRNLIVARPGMRLCAADSSQIEPRCAAWLAGDTEFLDLVAKGFSPYHAHAALTMDFKGANLKAEDDKLYSLAKARLLSLSYGAGFEKLIIMAKAVAGLDLTADDPEFVEEPDRVSGELKKVSGYGSNARKVVADYRASNPKITAVWKMLDEGLRRSVGEDYVVTLPSGRALRYENIRAEFRIEQDRETKKPRRRTVFTACIGGKRVITYGSKIFENCCQSLARDIFYWQVLQLDDAGYPMLFGVYDEFVAELRPDQSLAEVQKIMCLTPPWVAGCSLAAEAHELTCYTK